MRWAMVRTSPESVPVPPRLSSASGSRTRVFVPGVPQPVLTARPETATVSVSAAERIESERRRNMQAPEGPVSTGNSNGGQTAIPTALFTRSA